MTCWFTADLHLGHGNIAEYTGRPYRGVVEMNNDLVRRYNEVVADGDEVWIVGDLALGKVDFSLRWVGEMKGTKVLVPGNHDKMFRCQGTKYANTVQRYLDAGIAEVTEPELSLWTTASSGARVRMTVCHFPYAGDSRDGHEDRFVEHRPKNFGGFLVHGHCHGRWRKKGRMIDVGVDAWGGYPASFQTVADLFGSEDDADPLPWKTNLPHIDWSGTA